MRLPITLLEDEPCDNTFDPFHHKCPKEKYAIFFRKNSRISGRKKYWIWIGYEQILFKKRNINSCDCF